MATEKVFPKGISVFSPRQGAPDWVKGTVLITPDDLFSWLKEHPEYLSEYKGSKQIKLDLLEGKSGLYVQVNTYKPEDTAKPKSDIQESVDDLPF